MNTLYQNTSDEKRAIKFNSTSPVLPHSSIKDKGKCRLHRPEVLTTSTNLAWVEVCVMPSGGSVKASVNIGWPSKMLINTKDLENSVFFWRIAQEVWPGYDSSGSGGVVDPDN